MARKKSGGKKRRPARRGVNGRLLAIWLGSVAVATACITALFFIFVAPQVFNTGGMDETLSSLERAETGGYVETSEVPDLRDRFKDSVRDSAKKARIAIVI
ncbi:MAG: hypothetical protein GY721_04525, partial [Deltaproteobacteria bacterium]|nr:hypothetical protein [Deltaproteobacteria bacterium]